MYRRKTTDELPGTNLEYMEYFISVGVLSECKLMPSISHSSKGEFNTVGFKYKSLMRTDNQWRDWKRGLNLAALSHFD